MNAIPQLWHTFRDSPSFERNRARIFTGLTIGAIGLLLNMVVMIMALPLLMYPDSSDFQYLTQHLEFGELLSLIILGGATMIATIAIPARMYSVFMGPRIGRYFDQVVLSGISPMRFLMGNVASQNLFVGLVLFLLLPHIVLALTFGGFPILTFIACLFLVWLYCMMLSLVTIWATLYVNEILAAIGVIISMSYLLGLGAIPLGIQPFAMTPMPVLLHPVYSAIPNSFFTEPTSFAVTFLMCTGGMLAVSAVAMFSIAIGPLYGIIRDNSTFGEVVKAGDATKKRRFRIRHHIQRSSEMAFLYENRSVWLSRWEGLLRWGLGFGLLTLVLAVATGFRFWILVHTAPSGISAGNWAYALHISGFFVHGIGLAIAVLLFSHARNSTLLKIPLGFGRNAVVARLDTLCFAAFLILSTTTNIVFCYAGDMAGIFLNAYSAFPKVGAEERSFYGNIQFESMMWQVTLSLSLCAVLVYLVQRLLCLSFWMKIVSFGTTAGLYICFVCLAPVLPFVIAREFSGEYYQTMFAGFAPQIMISSPFMHFPVLCGESTPMVPAGTPHFLFYVSHVLLIALTAMFYRRQKKKLQPSYLNGPHTEPPKTAQEPEASDTAEELSHDA